MDYSEKIILKNGKEAWLRNGCMSDGAAVFETFNQTHGETDFLLSYPDENSFDAEQEGKFLDEKTKSTNGIEIIALVDGRVVGTAGIEPIGTKHKVKHRAGFGIGILREYWGLGLGRALTRACIQCARDAGYVQLELDVVADNERAIRMYRDLGFVEYGRNPRGFHSRSGHFQELIYMLLVL